MKGDFFLYAYAYLQLAKVFRDKKSEAPKVILVMALLAYATHLVFEHVETKVSSHPNDAE